MGVPAPTAGLGEAGGGRPCANSWTECGHCPVLMVLQMISSSVFWLNHIPLSVCINSTSLHLFISKCIFEFSPCIGCCKQCPNDH